MEAEEAEEFPGLAWGRQWIPVSRFGAIGCDCAGPDDAPTHIRDVDYHHTSGPGRIVARSSSEMVSWWIDALQDGGWHYDASRRQWNTRFGLIPPERERTGLM